MPKLKTYGVITEDEYRQAEQDGRFLIADTVACKYCEKPVRVDTDPQYFYCPQHYQLALTMYWYPGYPAVPMDAPRYRQMDFLLSALERNQPLFDRRQPEYIAREKGCPFCDRYLTPVDPNIETQRDASLLNQKMFCSDCGVSFRIEVIDVIGVLQIHFTPDAASVRHITAESEHSQTQHTATGTDADNDVEHDSDGIATRILSDPVSENQNENQPLNQPHAFDSQSPEHHNAHRDVKGQVEAYLTEHHIATTPKLLAVCNCSREALNQALHKLIHTQQIRKVKRGVYELINHT